MIPTDDSKAVRLGAAFAAAKINLALHVVGQRADGYHELDSLVVFADIGDTIEAFEAPAEAVDRLEIVGPFAQGLTPSPDNLVLRAAAAFDRAHPPRPSLRLRLTKDLPIASGIGGGSADAAATLRLLASLTGDDGTALADIAAPLGADVPMCLRSRSLRAQGIGEILTDWDGAPTLPMVLVNPGVAVSTPEVFRRLARRDNPPLPRHLPSFGDVGALADWLAHATRNDMQQAAIETAPAIDEALHAVGSTEGCLLARMSGSGATVFGLFGDAVAARHAAGTLAMAWPEWWVWPTSAGGRP